MGVKPLTNNYEQNNYNAYVERLDGQVARAVDLGSDVQHPTVGDASSIYSQDIDWDNSDFTDWVGDPEQLFKNPFSTSIVNNTSNNPKQIILAFKRTGNALQIGFGENNGGDFSNLKVSLLGSGGATRGIYDDSTDNTLRTSRNAIFENELYNSLLIEFHTSSIVSLSNITIQKSKYNTTQIQGKDDNGSFHIVKTTPNGYLAISDNSSGLAIAKGDVVGHSNISKFGQNAALNTSTYEDIWDGGGSYPYPADGTAPITHIYSTDNNDTEPIEIQCLDITGALTIQTKTLTGTTVVELDTPAWRVFRMKNEGTSDIVGVVHASDSGKVVSYAQIQNGNNQTLMALYTIPLGKTGYLQQGTNSIIGTNRGYSISGRMLMRPHGGVFQLKRTFGLSTDGTSFMIMPFPVPGKIPALTDIRVEAISSAAGGGLNTTFELVLVDD